MAVYHGVYCICLQIGVNETKSTIIVALLLLSYRRHVTMVSFRAVNNIIIVPLVATYQYVYPLQIILFALILVERIFAIVLRGIYHKLYSSKKQQNKNSSFSPSR